ncbi:protein FAR1-RELATED SEQUENCE 8-like [Lycium barbarum]|uniref:protein FAR1-RELATED SEQUENCE 8-like n=1 Tax=Lycium barbarum TaxID=112863 RepID=UPI00293F522A|nr:protein FAR1-RELATED SEQUENCE 8-like [Lycium barbarum]
MAPNRVIKTLNNVLGIDENDSLLSNGGRDDEDSDGSFNGGADSYVDSEDEELNMLALAEGDEAPDVLPLAGGDEELNMLVPAEGDEVMNMLAPAEGDEEMNMPDQGEEGVENSNMFDQGSDQEEYEDHGVEEDENGTDDQTFTGEEFLQGPIERMTFKSKESLFAFYKEHGRLKGFGVVKKACNKKGSDRIRYVSYGCDKGRKSNKKRQSKRVDYKATVNAILMHNGSWSVSKVNRVHNHRFYYGLSRFMPSHRDVSKSLKRHLVAHDIAGLRPSKSIRLLEVQAGGPENLRCTPKDCRNYTLQQRRLRTLTTDSEAVSRFLAKMQIKDREFYYAVDPDNAGRLRNVVWVYTHCKYGYREFHDVICFDTTYLVNQWRMSFASFIGVNQHRQSILLGYALVTSEDIDTYKYVFMTCYII